MSEHQPIPGTPAQQHAIRLLEIELMREEQWSASMIRNSWTSLRKLTGFQFSRSIASAETCDNFR